MQNSDIMLKMSGLEDLLQSHEPCAKYMWVSGVPSADQFLLTCVMDHATTHSISIRQWDHLPQSISFIFGKRSKLWRHMPR